MNVFKCLLYCFACPWLGLKAKVAGFEARDLLPLSPMLSSKMTLMSDNFYHVCLPISSAVPLSALPLVFHLNHI